MFQSCIRAAIVCLFLLLSVSEASYYYYDDFEDGTLAPGWYGPMKVGRDGYIDFVQNNPLQLAEASGRLEYNTVHDRINDTGGAGSTGNWLAQKYVLTNALYVAARNRPVGFACLLDEWYLEIDGSAPTMLQNVIMSFELVQHNASDYDFYTNVMGLNFENFVQLYIHNFQGSASEWGVYINGIAYPIDFSQAVRPDGSIIDISANFTDPAPDSTVMTNPVGLMINHSGSRLDFYINPDPADATTDPNEFLLVESKLVPWSNNIQLAVSAETRDNNSIADHRYDWLKLISQTRNSFNLATTGAVTSSINASDARGIGIVINNEITATNSGINVLEITAPPGWGDWDTNRFWLKTDYSNTGVLMTNEVRPVSDLSNLTAFQCAVKTNGDKIWIRLGQLIDHSYIDQNFEIVFEMVTPVSNTGTYTFPVKIDCPLFDPVINNQTNYSTTGSRWVDMANSISLILPPCTAPEQAGAFSSTGADYSTIDLVWTDSGNEQIYMLYWSTGAIPAAPGALLSANETTFTVSNLNLATAYNIWIVASNDCGVATNTLNASTLVQVPPPAVELSRPSDGEKIFSNSFYSFIWKEPIDHDDICAYEMLLDGTEYYTNIVQANSVQNGIIGHWKLNDTSGMTAVDSSSLMRNGTLGGDSAWTNGIMDGCLDFDGNDYVDLGIIDTGEQFTLALWAYIPSTASSAIKTLIANKRSGGNAGWALEINTWSVSPGDRKLHFENYVTTGLSTSSSPQFEWDTWQHIAAVVDRSGQEVRLYINGLEVTNYESTDVDTALPVNQRIYLGQMADYSWRMDGMLDDVRIYNRKLDPGEIMSLADSTSGLRSISGLDLGWHSWQVRAMDCSNNWGNYSPSCDFTIYPPPPAVTVITNTFVSNQSYELEFFVDKPYGYWSTNSVSGPYQSFSFTNGLYVSESTTLWYYGDDGAGSVGPTKSIYFYVGLLNLVTNVDTGDYWTGTDALEQAIEVGPKPLPGHALVVYPGYYSNTVTITDDGFSIISSDLYLDGEISAHNHVYVQEFEIWPDGHDVTIKGLTFINDYGIDVWNSVHGLIIESNRFYNGLQPFGGIMDSVTNVLVSRNLFSTPNGCWEPIGFEIASNLRVYNNTFDMQGDTHHCIGVSSEASSVYVSNNIFINTGTVFRCSGGDESLVFKEGNNLFSNNSSIGMTPSSSDIHPNGDHRLDADYNLKEGSEAIDVGVHIAGVTGSNFGGGPDIGWKESPYWARPLPDISISLTPDTWLVTQSFTFTGAAQDTNASLTGVYFSSDGSSWFLVSGTASWSTNVDLSPWQGTYKEFYFMASNDQGGTRIISQSQYIDITPAVVVISNPSPAAVLSGMVTYSGSAADPETGVDILFWSLNGSSWKFISSTSNWSVDLDTDEYNTNRLVFSIMAINGANAVSIISITNSPNNALLVPAIVTGVTASINAFPDKIELNWNAVSNADYYRVWRTEVYGQTGEPVSPWLAGVNFVDADVQPAATYHYYVVASNSDGISPPSTPQMAGSTSAPPIDPYEANGSMTNAYLLPGSIAFSNALISDSNDLDYFRFDLLYEGQIRISLYDLPEDYDLYLYDGDSNEITSSRNSGQKDETIILYTDTPGAYYVLVRGYKGSCQPAVPYSLELIWPNTNSMPDIPGAPAVSQGSSDSNISVSWEYVTNAVLYMVQRSDSGTGPWFDVSDWQLELDFSDTNAVSGRTYYYQLLARNSNGLSGPGTVTSGWESLASPKGFTNGLMSTTGVNLLWDAVSDADSYLVKRTTNLSGPWQTLQSGISTTGYSDSTAQAGISYFYRVLASNAWTYSSPSEMVPGFLSGSDTYENNDTTNSVYTVLENGGIYRSFIFQQNDIDYYRLEVDFDGPVRIRLGGLEENYDLVLYDDLGGIIATSPNSGMADEYIIHDNIGSNTYYVQVRSFQGRFSTTNDYELTIEFPVNNDMAAVPDLFSGTALDEYSVSWSWDDIDPVSTGFYLIDRYSNRISPYLGPDVTEYIETGLSADSFYSRRLVVMSVNGSNITEPASAYTMSEVPLTLSLTENTSRRVTVSWPPGGFSGCLLERSLNGVDFDFLAVLSNLDTVGSYRDETVAPDTAYWYRMVTMNKAGVTNSTPSVPLSVLTPPEEINLSEDVAVWNSFIDKTSGTISHFYLAPQDDDTEIKIDVYNLLGKKVMEIYSGEFRDLEMPVEIETSDLPRGVYFIRVMIGDEEEIRRVHKAE